MGGEIEAEVERKNQSMRSKRCGERALRGLQRSERQRLGLPRLLFGNGQCQRLLQVLRQLRSWRKLGLELWKIIY